MRAVVFANGVLHRPDFLLRHLRADDWIVAADGGARHCLALGLTPSLLIGDFDSLPETARRRLEAAGTPSLKFPEAKDQTDLELALTHVIRQGADEILVAGALGDRWDHSLANVVLGLSPTLASASLTFDDGATAILFLHSGQTRSVRGRPGELVSLIPLHGDARGIVTHGLHYPLAGETLAFGSTRGVSNVLEDDQATVSLGSGSLIVVHTRPSPPARRPRRLSRRARASSTARRRPSGGS
ncbi:MAG TPA: thiamine diphosphokinase [Anaerolineales bacterium]|nr:thiamine diphosphokinase [Anaerolineales bacterium]